MKKTYVVVDIETTGLKRDYHGITEIAAARFDGSAIVDEFHTLVNPGMLIPSYISKLTGITNDMVAEQPYIEEVIAPFFEYLGDDVFVAHNASFDKGFLEYNGSTHCGHLWTNDVLCTRKLANRIVPHLRSKSLGSLCEYFGVINVQAHRAMADVHATVGILQQFIHVCGEYHKGSDIEHLFDVHDKAVGYGKSIFGKVNRDTIRT